MVIRQDEVRKAVEAEKNSLQDELARRTEELRAATRREEVLSAQTASQLSSKRLGPRVFGCRKAKCGLTLSEDGCFLPTKLSNSTSTLKIYLTLVNFSRLLLDFRHSTAFQPVFGCKHWRRYSRERVLQSLPNGSYIVSCKHWRRYSRERVF